MFDMLCSVEPPRLQMRRTAIALHGGFRFHRYLRTPSPVSWEFAPINEKLGEHLKNLIDYPPGQGSRLMSNRPSKLPSPWDSNETDRSPLGAAFY
jgi:hypothetical protein